MNVNIVISIASILLCIAAASFPFWFPFVEPLFNRWLDKIKPAAPAVVPNHDVVVNLNGLTVHANGVREWRYQGELHRTDGPAQEYPDGDRFWYCHGKRHRNDGPALEWLTTDTRSWWKHGKRHRLNGPAVEGPDGYREWWIDDKQLSEQEFNQSISLPLPTYSLPPPDDYRFES